METFTALLAVDRKRPIKSAIVPGFRQDSSLRSLRSARFETMWLVKSVSYFDLIG